MCTNNNNIEIRDVSVRLKPDLSPSPSPAERTYSKSGHLSLKCTLYSYSNVEDVRWLEEPPPSSALVVKFGNAHTGAVLGGEGYLLCVRPSVYDVTLF